MARQSEDWVADRTFLLVRTGSHAYGTNIETSDEDFKGICVPPESYYFGMDEFSQHNISQKEIVNQETTILHIKRFFTQAVKGTPNVVEMLFAEKEDYLNKESFVFSVLLNNRETFLTQELASRLRDYAYSQFAQLCKSSDPEHPKGRSELIRVYGYDTKFFMHAMRLIDMSNELLAGGGYRVRRPDADVLVGYRNGSVKTAAEAQLMFLEKLRINDLVRTRTDLPEKMDYERANKLLTVLTKQFLIGQP